MTCRKTETGKEDRNKAFHNPNNFAVQNYEKYLIYANIITKICSFGSRIQFQETDEGGLPCGCKLSGKLIRLFPSP